MKVFTLIHVSCDQKWTTQELKDYAKQELSSRMKHSTSFISAKTLNSALRKNYHDTFGHSSDGMIQIALNENNEILGTYSVCYENRVFSIDEYHKKPITCQIPAYLRK